MSQQAPRPTERVDRVLSLATDEADSLGHGFVTCEHLLYALARESQGLATAALDNIGLTPDGIHQLLEEGSAVHDRTSKGRIDMADEARDAFERAVQAATEWGHSLLDTEHVLYGILIAPTSADNILTSYQIDPNDVLNDIYQLMQSAPAPQVRENVSNAYRFTLETVWVLGLATNFAQRLGGERVSSLHVLLGLLTLENTAAQRVLADDFALDADTLMASMGGAQAARYSRERLALNDDVQMLLGYAIGEAWNRGHASVRPIHLLMGLTRTERGVALNTLADFGVAGNRLEEAVEAAMPPSVK